MELNVKPNAGFYEVHILGMVLYTLGKNYMVVPVLHMQIYYRH